MVYAVGCCGDESNHLMCHSCHTIRLYPLSVVTFCGGSLLLHFPPNQRRYTLLAAVCGRYYCIIAHPPPHVVEWRPPFLPYFYFPFCVRKISLYFLIYTSYICIRSAKLGIYRRLSTTAGLHRLRHAILFIIIITIRSSLYEIRTWWLSCGRSAKPIPSSPLLVLVPHNKTRLHKIIDIHKHICHHHFRHDYGFN